MTSILSPTVFILLISSLLIPAHGQNKLNTIVPDGLYSSYLESFQKLKLQGPVKSIKNFAMGHISGDTLTRGFWFEFNRNKEMLSVASMISKTLPSWKLIFKNKRPVEGWRIQNDNSLKLTETYFYSKSGLLDMLVSTDNGYEEKTRYHYKDNTPIKSEKIFKGNKTTKEWIQNNDSTFSEVEFTILGDGRKKFHQSYRYIITDKKTTEIWYETKKDPIDIFSPLNEHFRRVRILNKKKQVIGEKSEFIGKEGPTIHKYRYDNSGHVTYHEQVDPKVKQVWENFYNAKGQDIRSTGKAYENGKELYSTLNIQTYDQFGNCTSENQSGSIYEFQYTYDLYNNWTTKKTYINKKLFEIEFREIQYFTQL